MEEKQMSEKESLALISQMIESTKEKLAVGSGNLLLAHGYVAIVLGVVVYLLVQLRGNHAWANLWFLMFLPGVIMGNKNKKKMQMVVTYTEKAINGVWQVIASLFCLTAAVLLGLLFFTGKVNFVVMMPLALIYTSIGVSITGVLLKEKSLVYTPFVGYVLAIYMISAYTVGGGYDVLWQLYFAVAFFFMEVVPGHILNYKSQKKCLNK